MEQFKRTATTIAFGMIFSLPGAWAQDGYLKALEAEAGKVEGTEESAEAEEQPNESVSDISQERFEAMLQEQYRGTFGFYQKLLPHIQEELVEEFRSGVSMADLREKIVDRYLQR